MFARKPPVAVAAGPPGARWPSAFMRGRSNPPVVGARPDEMMSPLLPVPPKLTSPSLEIQAGVAQGMVVQILLQYFWLHPWEAPSADFKDGSPLWRLFDSAGFMDLHFKDCPLTNPASQPVSKAPPSAQGKVDLAGWVPIR